LIRKPEVYRPFGRLTRRLEDNIIIYIKIVWGGGGVDWINMNRDKNQWQALVNMVTKLRIT
jgi:hypothetical protein